LKEQAGNGVVYEQNQMVGMAKLSQVSIDSGRRTGLSGINVFLNQKKPWNALKVAN